MFGMRGRTDLVFVFGPKTTYSTCFCVLGCDPNRLAFSLGVEIDLVFVLVVESEFVLLRGTIVNRTEYFS